MARIIKSQNSSKKSIKDTTSSSITSENSTDSTSPGFELLYRSAKRPNNSMYDLLVPSNKSSKFTQFQTASNSSTSTPLFIGIKGFNFEDATILDDDNDYVLELFMTSCLFWNITTNDWQSEGCRVRFLNSFKWYVFVSYHKDIGYASWIWKATYIVEFQILALHVLEDFDWNFIR